MCTQPDSRPLSLVTGYLLVVYLNLKQIRDKIDAAIHYMEQTQPWYDGGPNNQH